MGGNTTRQPVPAGGAPIPSAIEAADATPATTPEAETPEHQDEGAADTSDELVEARVLLDHDGYVVNSVISAPADIIDRLKLAGVVDPHADAVAFAKAG